MKNKLHTLNLISEVFRVPFGMFRIHDDFIQKDSEKLPQKYRTLDIFLCGRMGCRGEI